jgi:hypothetical protein
LAAAEERERVEIKESAAEEADDVAAEERRRARLEERVVGPEEEEEGAADVASARFRLRVSIQKRPNLRVRRSLRPPLGGRGDHESLRDPLPRCICPHRILETIEALLSNQLEQTLYSSSCSSKWNWNFNQPHNNQRNQRLMGKYRLESLQLRTASANFFQRSVNLGLNYRARERERDSLHNENPKVTSEYKGPDDLLYIFYIIQFFNFYLFIYLVCVNRFLSCGMGCHGELPWR